MCLIVYSYMLFVTILLVYEVDPLCLLVWALNANRWYVRVFMWTKIGRSCSLIRQGMTLGRLTTPKRGVFTSEHVPSRSETPLLRDVLRSGSSVEEIRMPAPSEEPVPSESVDSPPEREHVAESEED